MQESDSSKLFNGVVTSLGVETLTESALLRVLNSSCQCQNYFSIL